MSNPPVVIIPPNSAPNGADWADPWRHPELFAGVTVRRIAAYAIDVVVIAVLAVVVWFVGSLLSVLSFGLLLPVKALALALLPLAYHTLMVASRRSATLGMGIMGLKVRSLLPQGAVGDGRPTLIQAMIQVVAFYGSITLTGSLILLVGLFNARRRLMHDWLAGTVVVNEGAGRHDLG